VTVSEARAAIRVAEDWMNEGDLECIDLFRDVSNDLLESFVRLRGRVGELFDRIGEPRLDDLRYGSTIDMSPEDWKCLKKLREELGEDCSDD